MKFNGELINLEKEGKHREKKGKDNHFNRKERDIEQINDLGYSDSVLEVRTEESPVMRLVS